MAVSTHEPAPLRGGVGVLVGIFLLQLTLVSITFPITELSTETPILHIDAGYHWYQMAMARALSEVGAVLGYDPYFAAGNLAGVIPRQSAKVAMGLAMVLPGVSISVLYKFYIFFGSVLAPSFLTLGCMILGMRWVKCAVAGVLSVLLWWISGLHWYHDAGLASFVLQAYLCFTFFALIVTYLRTGGRWPLLLAGLVGGSGLLYHPLFPVTASFPVLAYVVLQARQWPHWRAKWLGLVIFIPAMSLALNLWWILPSISFGFVESSGLEGELPFQRKVDLQRVWQYLIPTWHGTSKLFPVLALVGIVGAFSVRGSVIKTVLVSLVTTWIAMSFFAWVGGMVPTVGAYTQPNRFATVAYLALAIPAAFGFTAMVRMLATRARPVRRAGAAMILIIASTVGAYALFEMGRELSYADVGRFGKRPPVVAGEGEYTVWLREWLSTQTTASARIMFETPLGRTYDNANLAGYLAFQENREFIGGPYLGMWFADAFDGHAFGSKLSDLPKERFLAYIEAYNIGWIVAHSDELKGYLEGLESVIPESQFKKARAYRVRRTHSYFSKGQGRITVRRHNRLVLEALSGDEVIVRYHYHPRLVSDPPTTIERISNLDDPLPFIRLVRPPATLTLYTR